MNVDRVRKTNRLKGFDYSSSRSYFVTICTKDGVSLFWRWKRDINGRPQVAPTQEYELSPYGEIVTDEILQISLIYENVEVEHFVVMPNHVHMVLTICRGDLRSPVPTLSRIIQQWKGAISKKMGFSPWQKSFHDHIIRDEKSFLEIAEYVRTNPENWESDKFYMR